MPLGFSRATFSNDPAGSETIIELDAANYGSSPGFAYSDMNAISVIKDELSIAQAPAQGLDEQSGQLIAANDATNVNGNGYQPLTQGTYRLQVQPFTGNFTNNIATGIGSPAQTMQLLIGIGGCGILNAGTGAQDHVASASFILNGWKEPGASTSDPFTFTTFTNFDNVLQSVGGATQFSQDVNFPFSAGIVTVGAIADTAGRVVSLDSGPPEASPNEGLFFKLTMGATTANIPKLTIRITKV